MAHGRRHGQKNVQGDGILASHETVVSISGPKFSEMRKGAVEYPSELTSPPKPRVNDLRMRNINLFCLECGEALRVLSRITSAQEGEVERRWNLSHSHSRED